jgi:cell division protein FtsQ
MDGGGLLLRPIAAGGRRRTPSPLPVDQPLPSFRFPLALGARTRRRRPVLSPADRRVPRHLGTVLTLAFFLGVGAYGMVRGGQYQWFRDTYGAPYDVAARAVGLGIERVTIAGLSQLRENEILQTAGISSKQSLVFLDAPDARERLERLPLVKTASVRKLFPHELVVTLTEREPFALWQRNGEVFVVAGDGTVIDLFQDARFANLPLVVGDEANARAREYTALLQGAGALRSKIRAGMLVSGRRWNLKMDNGIDVRLPELEAGAALARLAKLDREQKILDKDVLAIDLRMNDRVVVRLSEEASAARAEIMKKKPGRGAKGIDT